MQTSNEPQHDEINLVRLVRRFEKSVATQEEWDESAGQNATNIWLKAQKDLQKVKYTRQLIKNIESSDTELPSERAMRLNDIRVKVDKVEEFLKCQAKRCAPPPPQLEPILPRLPVPSLEEENAPTQEKDDGSSSPPPLNLPTDNLLLSPPDISYTPTSHHSASKSRSTALDFSSTVAARKPQGTQAHSSLHEELSTQLEHMAAQLKRNAVHFADSLSKDKAVVEAAGEKLEQNYDVMRNKNTLLKSLRSKSGSTTWLILGIVLVVLLVFMLMVSVIRFSRI